MPEMYPVMTGSACKALYGGSQRRCQENQCRCCAAAHCGWYANDPRSRPESGRPALRLVQLPINLLLVGMKTSSVYGQFNAITMAPMRHIQLPVCHAASTPSRKPTIASGAC